MGWLACLMLCALFVSGNRAAVAVDYPACEPSDSRTKDFSIAWTADHTPHGKVLDEPVCGDFVGILHAFNPPNRIRFAEDNGDAQSRFALLILDRDSSNSPLRNYAAVNIQTSDLIGDGFDAKAPASHIKVLQSYDRPRPRSGCQRYYVLLYRYKQTPGTSLPSINQQAQHWNFHSWAQKYKMELVGIRYWNSAPAGLVDCATTTKHGITPPPRHEITPPPRHEITPPPRHEVTKAPRHEPSRGETTTEMSRTKRTAPPRHTGQPRSTESPGATKPPRASERTPPPRNETKPPRHEATWTTAMPRKERTTTRPKPPVRATFPTAPLRHETTWYRRGKTTTGTGSFRRATSPRTAPLRHETTWYRRGKTTTGTDSFRRATSPRTAPLRHETTWFPRELTSSTSRKEITATPSTRPRPPGHTTSWSSLSSSVFTSIDSTSTPTAATTTTIAATTTTIATTIAATTTTIAAPTTTIATATTTIAATTTTIATTTTTIVATTTTIAATTTTAKPEWTLVRKATQESLGCTKLHSGHERENPRYDTKYETVSECQTACKNLVTGCNAINFCTTGKCYGKCQFQHCDDLTKLPSVQHKGSASYLYNPSSSKSLTTPTPPTIKHDAYTIKQDTTSIKQDTTTIKQDTTTIKQDVTSINEGTTTEWKFNFPSYYPSTETHSTTTTTAQPAATAAPASTATGRLTDVHRTEATTNLPGIKTTRPAKQDSTQSLTIPDKADATTITARPSPSRSPATAGRLTAAWTPTVQPPSSTPAAAVSPFSTTGKSTTSGPKVIIPKNVVLNDASTPRVQSDSTLQFQSDSTLQHGNSLLLSSTTLPSTTLPVGYVSKNADFVHNEDLMSVTIASAIAGAVVLAVVVISVVIIIRKRTAPKKHADGDSDLEITSRTPVRSLDGEAFLLNIDSGETVSSGGQKFEDTFVRF